MIHKKVNEHKVVEFDEIELKMKNPLINLFYKSINELYQKISH